MIEDELILLLPREAGEEGSENEVIKTFREEYRDQMYHPAANGLAASGGELTP